MFFSLIQATLWTLSLLILARAVVSWVYPRRDVEWVDRLYQLTDYILAPIRSVVPPVNGLDFSPFIALIFLSIILSVMS